MPSGSRVEHASYVTCDSVGYCKELGCLSPISLLDHVVPFVYAPVYTLESSIHSPQGVVCATPLWNCENSKFAGMLTVLDIIHLIIRITRQLP